MCLTGVFFLNCGQGKMWADPGDGWAPVRWQSVKDVRIGLYVFHIGN